MTQQEKVQYMVPISIPVFVPTQEITDRFKDDFPSTFKYLIDSGKFTAEEMVSYFQFRATLHEIAGSPDEFLNIYKQLKEALARENPVIHKPGGIITPNGF